MLLNTDKERIVIEVGSGWTKVLVGSSLGKRKKKGVNSENIIVKDTFYIQTPTAKIIETNTFMDMDKQFTPGFDKTALLKAVGDELHQRRIKTEKTIISIGDKSVVSREMMLPKVEEEKLRGIVSYELQEFLPIDPKQYLIDFKVIDQLKVGEIEKYKLIVAALPKKEGQFYHSLVQELGKEPFALDVTSNSISKLFERNMRINSKLREIENQTFAYVDIGYSSIKLHIIENGVLKFTRNIEGGIQPLTSNTDEKLTESELSHELVNKWTSSLEQMFKFYTSRETNRKIDYIFIFGGGALIPNIDQLFSELTGIPAEVIQEIDSIDLHKDCSYFSLPIFLNSVASLIRR